MGQIADILIFLAIAFISSVFLAHNVDLFRSCENDLLKFQREPIDN
jgi:hypothetical protein